MAQSILAASIVMIAFLIIMALIYYLVSRKGVKKRKEHYQKLHQSLQSGQKVQLSSGILGTLRRVDEEIVELEIKSGIVMEVSRYAISDIIK
ncbi:preprotein translocase subunit YajC [Enterococcus raffinosus]|jgi:preprotein translocase subunit YajC|uniref:preprotein translocase subunit YajC n=1 Tax=Enterococcus TaxID=1350 RepID=UPI001C48978A|nr:preprotein translocase subunit YajC [Enterococcus raffinosus]MDT2573140.1 preprotein translocase subunit YajC [Enterococcus raffinosus]QXJ60019.1 preprotein translocase subunit YajC [Enterococcus raffinosus]